MFHEGKYDSFYFHSNARYLPICLVISLLFFLRDTVFQVVVKARWAIDELLVVRGCKGLHCYLAKGF